MTPLRIVRARRSGGSCDMRAFSRQEHLPVLTSSLSRTSSRDSRWAKEGSISMKGSTSSSFTMSFRDRFFTFSLLKAVTNVLRLGHVRSLQSKAVQTPMSSNESRQ
eukprot:3259152-Rhodomonas_salina.1